MDHLQLDDQDGSRPVHLAAMGTIKRSVCCSAWSRLAGGVGHLQLDGKDGSWPINLAAVGTVPSGGQHAAARRSGRLMAWGRGSPGASRLVGGVDRLQLDGKDGSPSISLPSGKRRSQHAPPHHSSRLRPGCWCQQPKPPHARWPHPRVDGPTDRPAGPRWHGHAWRPGMWWGCASSTLHHHCAAGCCGRLSKHVFALSENSFVGVCQVICPYVLTLLTRKMH